MIKFERVSKTYQNKQKSLKNINLQIPEGEMVFVTGHSGAGKSTLLKLVAHLETASQGVVSVKGHDLSMITRKELPYYRRRIGFVFQNHLLLPSYTVFDNVALPLVLQKVEAAEVKKRTRAALEKVGLLHYQNTSPSFLSAGEQQRVGIARAVVHRPMILLADEPTGNLDDALSFDVMQTFSQFNQVGVTVLIATHNTSVIDNFSARVIRLQEGTLVRDTA